MDEVSGEWRGIHRRGASCSVCTKY